MKKKKIAIIGLKGLPAFGGAATVGENIIEQLKDKYDFTVYSTSSHTDLKTGNYNGYKQIVFKKIPFKRLNTLYYYILSALHALLLGKYDLVHLHHRDAAFIIPFLKFKCKILLTTHGIFSSRSSKEEWKKFDIYFKVMDYFFVPFANKISCVSLHEYRLIKKNLKIEPSYIPNGVNYISKFYLPKIEEKNYVFFGAGRIIYLKGCDLLFKALKKINYQGRVIIAGNIDYNNELKKELQSLSKGLNVNFVGLIKEKKLLFSYIANSKLFIFPSRREHMSMMLLEAASLMVPIIASDILQNRDIFCEEEVLYFKNDDYNDLADKINWALDNYEYMIKLTRNAYNKVIKKYTWDKIAEEYSILYDSLIN